MGGLRAACRRRAMNPLRWLLGRTPPPDSPPGLTYAADFVDFLAHSRGLDRVAAQGLVSRSQAQFAGGWAGTEYRAFTERALEVLRPLHDDTPGGALIGTYRAHAPLDFLRMLSYPIPPAAELSVIVDRLARRPAPRIVDYGCGLAHRSLAVARALRARGVEVRLSLVDIRREVHVAFLDFVCLKYAVPWEFVEVTAQQPYRQCPRGLASGWSVPRECGRPSRRDDAYHAQPRRRPLPPARARLPRHRAVLRGDPVCASRARLHQCHGPRVRSGVTGSSGCFQRSCLTCSGHGRRRHRSGAVSIPACQTYPRTAPSSVTI